jgi:transcriptional regulator with XRE-family HTH domain
MANQLGISQSGYQKIETGANNISLERLIQIAEILNKSVDVLIGNKENDKNNIFIQVSGEEYILMKRIISQQEKLIKELRGKLGIWDEV